MIMVVHDHKNTLRRGADVQSRRINKVNPAVTEVGKVTQSTAANAEGSSTLTRTSHSLCYSIFVLLLIFFSTPDLSATQRLILNTPGEPPYHYPDQTGIMDLWMKEAFARIGWEVIIDWQPPERGLENANRGIVDGDAGRIAGLSSRYENLIPVPEKIMVSEFVAFTLHSRYRPAGWQSLKPYNVAIVRGHKISEENVVGTRSLFKAANTEVLFSLLNSNRVDVAVCERLFGAMMAKKINPEIKVLEPPLARRDFYLYLHKKHEPLVGRIADAVKTMKRDGTYERLRLQGQKQGYDAK
jgi:polar amino acid transport system substrate-binding protein